MRAPDRSYYDEGAKLYDHGLPFSKALAENLEDLDKRVKNNKASLVIVDGMIGEGKTTLAMHVADYVNFLNDKPPVDLGNKHPQLSMGGADFLKKLRACYDKDLPVVIYDEAGDFNKRGSLTRFNAMMNRTFETFRGFKIMVIVVLPSAHVLDQDLFDKGIPRMLLHTHGRTGSYGSFKAYSLYKALYIKEKMKKLVVKPFAYSIVHANHHGHFLDLSAQRSKLLDYVSTEGKLSMLRQSEIKVEGLMGYTEMANKVGRSVYWCRLKVAEHNIKHKRTINRVKYFDDDAVNRLMEVIEEAKENHAAAARSRRGKSRKSSSRKGSLSIKKRRRKS